MLTPPTPPAGPPASLPPPTRRAGRRINRVPAIAAVVVGCVVVSAIAYTLHERALNQQAARELARTEPSGADASGILKNAPNGYIPAAVFRLPPAPKGEPAAEQKKKEETEDDNGREEARKAAWHSYRENVAKLRQSRYDKHIEALVALKTSVDAGERGSGEAATAPAAPALPASVAPQNSFGGGWGGGATPGVWGGGFPGLATPQIDREGQDQKIAFAGQAGDLGKNDVVPTVRKPPDPFALMAGSFVKFTTINEVNSDVPGSQIGMVSESVYNTSDGTCVLIPQGSRLIGKYNSVVSAGQDRLPGVLTRIIFPDGSSQAIGAMETADNAGAAGQEDQINRHLLQKFGGALLAGAFGAAIQLSMPQGAIGGYSSQQVIAASLGQQMGQLGQQIALQSLSIPNTVTIRAGFNGTMITDKDLHITPWRCEGTRRASIMPIMQVSP